MRDTVDKTDDSGDTLSAPTFNQLNSELENVPLSADITLDPEIGPDSSLDMLSQAIAGYAGAGLTYIDSGSASTYTLTNLSNLKKATKYFNGFAAIFKATNPSSLGASTINVQSLGIKDLKKPGGAALDVDSIVTNNIVICIYNLADDRFELLNANLFATDAEAIAQTRTDKALTPKNLESIGQTATIDRWTDGIAIPTGFLECDGTAVSRTTYSALFAVIGTDFGIGDGSTTFNLPNIAAIDGGNGVDLIAIIKY